MSLRVGQCLVGLALVSLAAACTPPPLATDVSRVRDLASAKKLSPLEEGEVDLVTTEEVRGILAKPIDVEAAVRVALLNNRELRARLRELGIVRGQITQAGTLPNPLVELELLPERNTTLEARVEYDVTRAVLAPLRARALAPELEASRVRVAGEVVDLGYRVRAAYYRAQAAEQRLAFAQKVLDAFATSRDATRAMHAAGNVNELTLASHEAAYERARVVVAKLELDVVSSREELRRLQGTHGDEADAKLAGPLPPPPERAPIPEKIETAALRVSLDLVERKHRIESLARRAGITRVEGLVPDVALDVHGLTGNPEAPSGGSSTGPWRFGGGVAVGVPLFDRRQGQVSALEAELDATFERYLAIAVDVRSAARETRARVVSAHARARQYTNVIVPAQRRVTEQTLLQYNAMQIGIYPLLQAHREELEAELARVDAVAEYWTAVAELDALLAGKRVRGGAEAPAPTRMSAPQGGH